MKKMLGIWIFCLPYFAVAGMLVVEGFKRLLPGVSPIVLIILCTYVGAALLAESLIEKGEE